MADGRCRWQLADGRCRWQMADGRWQMYCTLILHSWQSGAKGGGQFSCLHCKWRTHQNLQLQVLPRWHAQHNLQLQVLPSGLNFFG
ncbi:hypothetical protein DUNSADRAFT_4520 [Dunaliella salina]|uniref:Encoded protein n=1 Tax=Dunaliella salina TaxID=3046 RepID=A0ABQ7FUS1_DUNSA|nr:hypothetical protein DUNSADRAFT_4520 [Dunaliella salina]|eukprot:KAF5826153.1 hypothetical protein DUNSADRAFT_4520 [Dunaliella salina]